METRRTYAIITTLYSYEDNGTVKQAMQNVFYNSKDDSGFLTTKELIDKAREGCEEKGHKYVEDSFSIMSVSRITKALYEKLSVFK